MSSIGWEARTMSGDRWWHAFFATTVAVLVALTALGPEVSERQRVGAFVTLALLTLAYVTIGRIALRTGRFRLTFSLLLILGSGVVVACSPNTAVVQAIAFPLLWTVIEKTPLAIAANFALAISVSIGFLTSLGAGPDEIAQTAVIEGISVAGSLALGLWITRIAELSNERQRLLDELTATQAQLAVAHRETGVTSERERLAREIHDTIAQSLTGVVMLSQRAQRELASGDLDHLAERLGLLEEITRDALVETRSLVAAVAPVELGGGIVSALDRLGLRFTRETGIVVTVTSDRAADSSGSLERDSEVVLLRCVQEALANVRKHSGASSATVELVTGGAAASITVHDNGRGFDSAVHSTGFGLPGMRDRLALVKGVLSIDSAAGAGTTITVSLPIAAPVSTARPA